VSTASNNTTKLGQLIALLNDGVADYKEDRRGVKEVVEVRNQETKIIDH